MATRAPDWKSLLETLRRGAVQALALVAALPRPSSLPGLPWVSVGIGVAALLACAVMRVGYASDLATASLEVRTAVDFAIQNPAVEIEPRLLPAIRGLMPGFDSNEMFSFLRKRDQRDPLQDEFDLLVEVALEDLDAHPYRALGLVPALPRAHTFATYPFVHVGWMHALLLAALLLLVGPPLERTWGRRVFAGALLILAGLPALLLAVVHAESERALVGAGVWVVALSVAGAVRFREERIDLGRALAPDSDIDLVLPGWALLLPGVACAALLPSALSDALPPGLDAAPGWTGLGAGALLGGLLAFGIQGSGLEARLGGEAPVETVRRTAQRFDFANVLALRKRGDHDAAWEMLCRETERSCRNRDAVVTYFEMAVERGCAEQAAPAMRQLIREELRRSAPEIAVSHWRTLCEGAPGALLEPELLVKLVPAVRAEGDDELAVLALQQASSLHNRAPAVPTLVEIARLAADLDQEIALGAARSALDRGELREDQRAELTALVRRLDPDDPLPGPEGKQELPPNVFYEEQDRSMFDAPVGDLGELTAPGDEEYAPGETARDPEVTVALPLVVKQDAVVIHVPGRGRAPIPWSHVHDVAVVGVRDLGPRPVVLIDLVVTGAKPTGRPRRLVRFRSDQFDVRKLVPNAPSALAALREFVGNLAARAGCTPLPAADGAQTGPIQMFETVREYQNRVLRPRL